MAKKTNTERETLYDLPKVQARHINGSPVTAEILAMSPMQRIAHFKQANRKRQTEILNRQQYWC
jgi:hypothetical protein